MDEESRQKLAEDRAEVYAPAPTGGLVMAGVCGAVLALGADFAVSGFYGWEVRNHLLLSVGVTLAGFLIGLLGYKRLARANRRATRAERREIDTDQADGL